MNQSKKIPKKIPMTTEELKDLYAYESYFGHRQFANDLWRLLCSRKSFIQMVQVWSMH